MKANGNKVPGTTRVPGTMMAPKPEEPKRPKVYGTVRVPGTVWELAVRA